MANKLENIYCALLKKFGPQHWWPVTSDNAQFEIVIGAILTQNTAWKNVEKAIEALRKNSLIDIEKIKKINQKQLAKLIRSAGYYNQKAERLKIIANFLSKTPRPKGRSVFLSMLRNRPSFSELKLGACEGAISDMSKNKNPAREQLLDVKGIGPETADSILLYAFNKPIFVIDAYTKRIMARLGFKEEGYDGLQELFMNNLKKDHRIFNEYHALLVELGKNYCKKKPNCENCPITKYCKRNN